MYNQNVAAQAAGSQPVLRELISDLFRNLGNLEDNISRLRGAANEINRFDPSPERGKDEKTESASNESLLDQIRNASCVASVLVAKSEEIIRHYERII